MSRRRYDEKERKKRKKKKGKRRAERKLLEESLFSSKPREGRSEFCVEGGMRLPSLIDKLNSYDPSSCVVCFSLPSNYSNVIIGERRRHCTHNENAHSSCECILPSLHSTVALSCHHY